MPNVAVETMCPFCHEVDTITLTEKEYENYLLWQDRVMLIQDALPNKTPSEREQLKTGICPHCWETLFGGKDDE